MKFQTGDLTPRCINNGENKTKLVQIVIIFTTRLIYQNLVYLSLFFEYILLNHLLDI